MFDPSASQGPGSGGSSGPSGSASFDSGAFDVAALRDLAAKAAGVDVSLAGDEELMCDATALEEVRSLVDVAQGHVLARLEADGTTDRLAGHRTVTWLFHEARRSNAQGELIALARRYSFEHWASLVRRLASEFDEDGGYDPNEDIHANRLRFSSHGDLTVELAGRLDCSAPGDRRADAWVPLLTTCSTGSRATTKPIPTSRSRTVQPCLRSPSNRFVAGTGRWNSSPPGSHAPRPSSSSNRTTPQMGKRRQCFAALMAASYPTRLRCCWPTPT